MKEESTRVALIPGGIRGIGFGIAKELAAEGWSIALAYRTSEEQAARSLAELKEIGAVAIAERCDVSQRTQCEALVRTTEERLGPIEALIHAAGPYRRVPLLEEDSAAWRAIFDANLHAFFDTAQLVAPGMRERGRGRLLSFGIAGTERLSAQSHITAHSIAKAGLIALTRSFAEVLGPFGITANTISPGFVDTGSGIEESWRHMAERIPARRLGEIEDVVAAARFLLSDEARYVNGANLVVSGGWGV